MTTPQGERNAPPRVVLEHLKIGPQEIVRVVGWTHDEMESHRLAQVMANAGLRVWVVELWPEDGGQGTAERYVGGPHAAWMNERGLDPTREGDELTEQGQ